MLGAQFSGEAWMIKNGVLRPIMSRREGVEGVSPSCMYVNLPEDLKLRFGAD